MRHVRATVLVLMTAAVSARSASAACNPPKFASTYNPATGTYVYWTTTIP